MNKRIIIGIVVVISVVVLFFLLKSTGKSTQLLSVSVSSGEFQINVVTTGELQAKNSEEILGPSGLRTVGIWNVQISELVPEGTIVNEGDFVATLDRTEISNKLKDVQTELEKLETQYVKTRLDTTLELRNARDELLNLKFFLDEKQIALEQSKYEPPATIRQAELELQKAERTYNQAVKNYELRYEQSKAKMQEVTASLDQQKRRLENMLKVLDEFTVLAPKPGMVIYRRDWDGKKITVGSQISTWNNVIATLPDFSVMISKTYVNEIDISKIKTGQKVDIGIDAFPDKKFTGEVYEVANVGEQRPNSDSKVFEVKIRVNEFDSILRPAMTTKNSIIIATVKDVLFIPLEALFTEDSIVYVYKISGNSVNKQQVKIGQRNENEVIITQGLATDDKVLLSTPENANKLKIKTLE